MKLWFGFLVKISLLIIINVLVLLPSLIAVCSDESAEEADHQYEAIKGEKLRDEQTEGRWENGKWRTG